MKGQITANHAIGEQSRHPMRHKLEQSLRQVAQLVFTVTIGSVMVGAMTMVAEPLRAEDISLSPKFTPDPKTYTGTASGSVDCKVTQEASAPKYDVELLRSFGFLRLQVDSSSPIMVKVVGPSGVEGCTPTTSSSRFVLAGEWLSGKYRIWVGTPQGSAASYKLIWSETR